MNIIVGSAIAAAWLAILAMLAWGVVSGWRRVMEDERPLPFFGKLDALGVSVPQAQEAVGMVALSAAVRRCALCSEKAACAAGRRVACPNTELLARLRG